jgi:hypothetical protein
MNNMDSLVRTDAQNVGIIEQGTRYMMPEIARDQYAKYKFADGTFVDVNDTPRPGVKVLQYTRVTSTGAWRLASGRVTDDNEAGFTTQSIDIPVEYFEETISYNVTDVETADFARGNFPQGAVIDPVKEKMISLGEAYMQKINAIWSVGIAAIGLYGLFNNPDAPRITFPYALGAGTTADNNLALLNQAYSQVVTQSGETYMPNMILLPYTILEFLQNQIVGTNAAVSVIERFQKSHPNVGFDTHPALNNVGAASKGLLIAYEKSAANIEAHIPKPMTQVSPFLNILGKIAAKFNAQFSGVVVKRPQSIVICDLV